MMTEFHLSAPVSRSGIAPADSPSHGHGPLENIKAVVDIFI